MKAENYIKMRKFLAGRPKTDHVIHILADILTFSVYLIYSMTALNMLIKKSKKLPQFLGVPAAVFAIGSLIRAKIDAPRPYDELDLPINNRKKKHIKEETDRIKRKNAGEKAGRIKRKNAGEKADRLQKNNMQKENQDRAGKHGKSFPSRHTFSASVIAVAFTRINPVAGIGMTFVAAGVGLSRILMGVHWIRDVVGGFIFGTVGGIIGYLSVDKCSAIRKRKQNK